jgi:hypothetical protein
VSLIADMSAMQQQARTGETRRERRQCDERGVGSGDATKNDATMALGGGGGDGQRYGGIGYQIPLRQLTTSVTYITNSVTYGVSDGHL